MDAQSQCARLLISETPFRWAQIVGVREEGRGEEKGCRQRDGFVAGLRAWVDTLAWPRSAALAGPELAYQSGAASQAAVEIEIVVVGVAVVVYIITVKITVATCLCVYVCVCIVNCKLFSNGECGLSKCELTIEANSRPLSLYVLHLLFPSLLDSN